MKPVSRRFHLTSPTLKPNVYLFVISISILLAGCNVESVQGDTSLPIPQPTNVVDSSLKEIVRPGAAIGPISLGDSFVTVLETLPFKKNYDEILEPTTSWLSRDGVRVELSSPREYRWRYAENGSIDDITFFFFERDKVFQIETRSRRYRLENGVGVGSTRTDVLAAFPEPEEFDFDYGQPRLPGYFFESYLVYQDKGLAFQVTSDHNAANHEITMVIVFMPERQFLPRGNKNSSEYMKKK